MKKLYTKAPSQLPPFGWMAGDIPNGSDPEALGNHLGVSGRTARRWLHGEDAPRSAQLAVFWESRWGRGAIDADLVNSERVQRGLAQALERENAALRARIARLEAIGSFGSANGPLYTPVVLSLSETPHAIALGL